MPDLNALFSVDLDRELSITRPILAAIPEQHRGHPQQLELRLNALHRTVKSNNPAVLVTSFESPR